MSDNDLEPSHRRQPDNKWEQILYGDPPELVRVPSTIEADAVRKK